jgi:hypothetical protein
MSDVKSQDATAKNRIVQHMNKDHQDSLVRYLEHYCHVPSYRARNAHLDDITFESMIIGSSGHKYTVRISPPLTSWSEARARVVAMDVEARDDLQRSDITIKSYTWPKPLPAIVPISVILTLAAFTLRSNFRPGSYLYDEVLYRVPGFAHFCYTIQPLVMTGIIVIHTFEVLYMASSRLKKHSVPMFSLLWWEWVVNTFFEGYGTFVRFDGMVRKEEEARAKRKH